MTYDDLRAQFEAAPDKQAWWESLTRDQENIVVGRLQRSLRFVEPPEEGV